MKSQHTHKYLRKDIGSKKDHPYFVYQCVLNCSHYVRESLIIGRKASCWDCNEEFVIKQRGTRPFKKKPICDSCWNKKYGKEEEPTDKNIEKLLKEAGAL